MAIEQPLHLISLSFAIAFVALGGVSFVFHHSYFICCKLHLHLGIVVRVVARWGLHLLLHPRRRINPLCFVKRCTTAVHASTAG